MAAIIPFVLGGLTFASGIMQTNAAVAGLQAQRDAAKMNADAKVNEAQAELMQANIAEEDQRREARRIMGEQRAAIAQAGTGLLSSTNLRLVGESATAAEQDALNIRYGGMLQAHGLLTQAQQYRYEAQVAESQIGPTRRAGYVGAVAGALGAFAQGGGTFGGGGPKTGAGGGRPGFSRSQRRVSIAPTTGGYSGPR